MLRSVLRPSRWIPALLGLVCGAVLYFLTTDSVAVWPARNVLAYHLHNWWTDTVGSAPPAGVGVLRGCVLSSQGAPVAGASVLVAERNGTTHATTADQRGCYRLAQVPAGRYVPVADAPDFAATSARSWGLPIGVAADSKTVVDLTLPPVSLPTVAPGRDLRLSEPVTLTWELPQPSRAVRREVQFDSVGRPNQLTYLYTPASRETNQRFPLLLAVYPGPADTWEGVSIPLAAAGYAVVGVGPEYSLELDADIDELQRLVGFARAGLLPGVDGRRIVVLGGSYSGLHVQRLIHRDNSFRGAVLLGPPSDLFDLRRRFEAGTFFPPFGLDQALIALGTPDKQPERYWRYSARWYLRADLPPLLLMHSRDDEVVPFQQTEIWADQLERQGATFEAHFFDGMSHYLLADRPSEELDMLYTITLDFLERTTSKVEAVR